MLKTFFIKFKIYFFIAAFLAVVIGTWMVRGWYEDGKIVDALETQKKEYEKQADKDADAFELALGKEQGLRNKFRGLYEEANKVKLCTNGGNDFLGLFNRNTTAANEESEASSVPK